MCTELKVVVPKADQKTYDVSIAAIEQTSGELAAPIKEMTLAISDPSLNITPASAEPDAKTSALSEIISPLKPAAVAETSDAATGPAEEGRHAVCLRRLDRRPPVL